MHLPLSNPTARFLDKLANHSALGEAERQAILGLPVTILKVQSNRDFVRLGDRADHAHLVADGLIGRFGENGEGQRQIMAVHIPGDIADLHSVVVPAAGRALQALTSSTILRIPHSALREAARAYPAIAEALWRECALDAAILAEWVLNVGRRQARARAAHLLCEMAFRYRAAKAKGGFSFVFPVTQNHLADILALTPVHVNRTLKILRTDGLAAFDRGNVDISDWSALVEAGEFDPAYLELGGSPKVPPGSVASLPERAASASGSLGL